MFYEEATRGRSASHHLQARAALALLYNGLGSRNPFAECGAPNCAPENRSYAITPARNWAALARVASRSLQYFGHLTSSPHCSLFYRLSISRVGASLDEQGRPSFQLLQNSGSSRPPIFFYAFDLLNLEGEDHLDSPIERRRELLNELLGRPADPLRLSPLLQAPAGHVLEAVQKLGLEGVVGKRVGSVYERGERSGAWIKGRINRAQEFVIGGFVPGSHGLDSLIVGVYEKKRLTFVAKVRNGFLPRIRDEIFPQLKKRIIDDCPFTNLPEKKASRWGEALTAEKMKECRWVEPELVCQVAFVEWTDGGKLRHCTFVGMRDDKAAPKIVRET